MIFLVDLISFFFLIKSKDYNINSFTNIEKLTYSRQKMEKIV